MINKEILQSLYCDQMKPMHVIASELGVAVGTVYNYIHKYNIPARKKKDYPVTDKEREAWRRIGRSMAGRKRSEETRRKVSEAHKLHGVGHKKLRNDGYISVYYPEHPRSAKEGYIMEHHLVMEKIIGRPIAPGEVVHHRNHIRNDNRIENLSLMTFKEHCALHTRERHAAGTMKHFTIPVKNATTGEIFESASAAASAYGVARNNITAACKGKKKRIKGCVWEYADPERKNA